MATGSMTRAERDEFLAAVRVAVLSVDDPGRGPLAVPVWYLFEDGDILIETDRTSKKARLLEAAGRASITVQTETAPYLYVTVEGPAVIEPNERDVEEIPTRYLGPELGAWYAKENPHGEDSVVIRLTPEHWNTMDFNKVLAG